jgi:hypothetical protein
MGGSNEGIYKHQLVRIELLISVDQEFWSRMDHIASAPAAHHVTQVGFTTITVNVDKRNNGPVIIIVCVDNETCSSFPPEIENKQHHEAQFVHLFMSSVRSQTVMPIR